MHGVAISHGSESYDDFHSEKRGGEVSIKSQLRGRPHLQRQQFRKGSLLKPERRSEILLHVMNCKKDRPASEISVANSDHTVQVTLKRGMSASSRCFEKCLGDFIERGKQPHLERTPRYSARFSYGHTCVVLIY